MHRPRPRRYRAVSCAKCGGSYSTNSNLARHELVCKRLDRCSLDEVKKIASVASPIPRCTSRRNSLPDMPNLFSDDEILPSLSSSASEASPELQPDVIPEKVNATTSTQNKTEITELKEKIFSPSELHQLNVLNKKLNDVSMTLVWQE